jgi:hypothetical protein
VPLPAARSAQVRGGWKDGRNDPSRAITSGDDVPWLCGDVALVDNFVAMHGRRTFTGTRKVLASLIAS